jgi:hypothetical protein
MLEFKLVSGDFYEFIQSEQGQNMILYKNCVEVMDFAMISRILPQLDHVSYSKRDELPYFTAGLTELADKIRRGEKVAVEGGPCLFGTDEVKVEVVRRDGRKDYFDYNTGKSYLESVDIEADMDFREFVKLNGSNIKAIHFENRKSELTPQEWAFIKYPFEIAEALSAPLVIPIPDMSYIKYLDAVLRHVDDNVRYEALSEFRSVGHEISNLYIEIIDRMRLLHPNVCCEVVHDRDIELCQKYYRARAPYIERNKIARNLTGIPEKLESIKDYVTMPALPYYLFGIENVLEVDSMDETDSFRKCRKAHKQNMLLSCILYPELLSEDKVHTIFDAPYDRKEYGHYVVV